MKFVCERHPQLVIHDLGVVFVDGAAEVDTKTAAELRKLPAELGIHETSKPTVDGEPRRGPK